MADESRWDEDERRRRWEEERFRRGGQYGRESQYGREGYGRDERDWRGEGRGMEYGYGGGYGGDYPGEHGRGPRHHRWRGGHGRRFGGPGHGEEFRGGRSGRDQGYVGFGADQGFWRSDTDAAGMGGYGPVPEYGAREPREGRHRGRGPRGYTRSDERIREDVCDRLADDPMIDASDIEVQVANAEVTLNGHVDSRWLKRRAEDIVDDISGVRHVQNNLRIKEWSDEAQQPGDTSSTAILSGRPARRE